MTNRRHGRRYYPEDLPLDEAIAKFHDALREAGSLGPCATETVPLAEGSEWFDRLYKGGEGLLKVLLTP